MRVLNLVTTPRPFFTQQVETLERRGVDCETVTVPRPPEGGRGLREYLRFSPGALGHAALGDYDLVHANYGLVAPFALAQPRRPVVLTLWGTELMSSPWLRRLSTAAARLADATILPSERMAPLLECEHDLVPFGVDTDHFRPIARVAARERVGWDPDERVVLFPYDPRRDEKDHSRARRLVDRVEADAALRVVTGVPYAEMPYYVNASDALLVTSRRESGPMVVKEAAACNVPVVSTDVGFAGDVLGGVSNCTVSDDDDALVAALDRVLETRPRSDGRAAVDGLSLDAMAERIHGVYERVLDRRGPR